MAQRLRIAGTVLLLAGMAAAGWWLPSLPEEDWTFVHAFQLGDAQCRALREARGTTSFVCPAALEDPVTVAEVARRFNLELALVCQANDLDAACGDQQLEPGTRLALPLVRGAPEPPAPEETR